MNNQKGFNIVGVIAVAATLAIIGCIGFYVLDKSKVVSNVDSSTSASTEAKKTTTTTQAVTKTTVPEGFLLYESTNPKFSFAYLKEWEDHKTKSSSKGVEVKTFALNETINQGYGSPTVLKYETASKSLINFDAQNNYKSEYQPPVLWKDDSKTVYNLSMGEGGGMQNRIGFVVGDKIVIIYGPFLSGGDKTVYDSDSAVVVNENPLEQMAKSVAY